METFGWLLGFAWGGCGVAAAFMGGKPWLWRMTLFLGPLAFLIVRPNE